MARPARITDADAKALRRLSGVDSRLKGADTAISGLQSGKLARDGLQDMLDRIRTVRAHAGANRVMAEYAMSDGDTIRLLIDTDGGVRWRNETTLTDLFKVHRTGKMELLSGSLGLPGNPSFPLEAVPRQYVDSITSTDLTLLNGSTHGSVSARVYRDHAGFCWMDGYLQPASGVAKGTVVGRVPTSWRPQFHQFNIISAHSTHHSAAIDINPSTGDIVLRNWSSETGSPVNLRLGGVCWKGV